MKTYSVLIVEDDPRFSMLFSDAVHSADDLHLAGMAEDLPEGLHLLTRTQPDVLLVDIGLPSGSGIDLIHHAKKSVPHCESMVVTVFADDQAVIACIEAGAMGYLLKDSCCIDIVQQIRLLCSGGSPISPAIARRLLLRIGVKSEASSACESSTPPVTVTLSIQEHAVLSMSAKGYNYAEIAQFLKLSRHTVETYVKRIYQKLQVHSKTEAVYEARKLGLMHD